MPRYQINVRMDDDEDMYLYLHKKDNYSEYIKGLINRDRLKSADPQFINTKIQEHKKAIWELQELKKSSREDSEEVKKILEIGLTQYNAQMDSPMPDLHSFKLYLRSNILPKLTKAHCNRYDVDSLLEMYQKGVINV